MYQMTTEERAERELQKLLHHRMRAGMRIAEKTGSQAHRYMLLAWGFVRGFKFRRMERSHHMQGAYEHNMPRSESLHRVLKTFIEVTPEAIHAWLCDPSGAIAAPAPKAKPKKDYVPFGVATPQALTEEEAAARRPGYKPPVAAE